MLLFGPVFWHELRRMSRRQRYRWLCCLLALGMLAALVVVHQQQMTRFEQDIEWRGMMVSGLDRQSEAYRRVEPAFRVDQEWRNQAYQEVLVRTGEVFFIVFMAMQWVVLLCLTPAVVAGAIAEEKEKRTVDYLFTTHLTAREIVVGKLLSRLAVLLMILLSGIPVMCMAFSLGGIVPQLLQYGYLITVTMMLSLASVSILHSMFARKVRQAILNSYLTFGGYFLGWGVLEFLRGLMWSGTDSAHAAKLMGEFIELYNVGNPFTVAGELTAYQNWSVSYGGRPVEIMVYFLLFHGAVIVICLVASVLNLRAACLRPGRRRTKPLEAAPQPLPPAAPKPPPRTRARPPVGDWPMFWKECHAERTYKLGPLGKSIQMVAALVLGAPALVYFLPVSIIALAIGMDSHFTENARAANAYLRVTGAILVTWIILSMSVRAATCISSERERQTWESLLASPLPLGQIILAKWFGCWWSVRWQLVLLAIMCLCMSVTGGLFWPCLFLLFLQLLAWGSFFAALGLWLSARCKNAVTALTVTMLVFTVFSGLPWLAHFWKQEWVGLPMLERVSPSCGMTEICVTKEDTAWTPQVNRRHDEPRYEWLIDYSPRGDKRIRYLEQIGYVTLLNVVAFLLFARGLDWMTHNRLRREGGV